MSYPASLGKHSITMGESAQLKFKQDLSRFENSMKEMQRCLKTLNETLTELYGESLPRPKEFLRALQDENTLVENFVRDTHEVEDHLRRHNQQYEDNPDCSSAASANRSRDFAISVLGALFKGQNIFFSESFKVSKVLQDIISQIKHNRPPTPREVRVTREIQEKLDGKQAKGAGVRLPRVGDIPAFLSAGGHRGPGALVGGAYGSQQPQSKGVSAQIKPASRFSAPPLTVTGTNRIYI